MSGCSNEWLAGGHFEFGVFGAIIVLRRLKFSNGHERSTEDSSHSPTRAWPALRVPPPGSSFLKGMKLQMPMEEKA